MDKRIVALYFEVTSGRQMQFLVLVAKLTGLRFCFGAPLASSIEEMQEILRSYEQRL